GGVELGADDRVGDRDHGPVEHDHDRAEADGEEREPRVVAPDALRGRLGAGQSRLGHEKIPPYSTESTGATYGIRPACSNSLIREFVTPSPMADPALRNMIKW